MKTNRVIKTVALALMAAALTTDVHAMCCGGFRNPFRQQSAQVAPVDMEVKSAKDQLWDAIWIGDVEGVLAALAAGAQLRPFHLPEAAAKGHLAVVQALIAAGADVNATSSISSWPPLINAAIHGHAAVVQELLRHGADVNVREVIVSHNLSETGYDYTPGNTALEHAAERGFTNVVQVLLAPGIGADVRSREHALLLAAHNAHLATVRMLIVAGVNVTVRDSGSQTPLHKAADVYIDVGVVGWTRAYEIAREQRATVQELLNRGADVNARDFEGSSPLHIAAIHGNIKVVRMLIAAGANVNDQNTHGSTPLHQAAYNGYSNIVGLLLTNGARTDITANDGETAADVARIHVNNFFAWCIDHPVIGARLLC